MKNLICITLLALSALVGVVNAETIVDSRDGQLYRTVKIGKQEWMAENLNYNSLHSWCYNNDEKFCKIYGRLYIWDTAKESCPAGWRLPKKEDFETLWAAVGGVDKAGDKLKAKDVWTEPGAPTSITDEYGFSLEPAGTRLPDGNYFLQGTITGLWTATKDGKKEAVGWFFEGTNSYAADISELRRKGLSVRCIRK